MFTDVECGLDWPEIQLTSGDGTGNIITFRRRPVKAEISIFMMWVLYSSIRDNFGNLIDCWLEMRTRYGAAFHSYLGVRRGIVVYVEHRFANLMWGIEALHRKVKPVSTKESEETELKIKKICVATKSLLNKSSRSKLRDCLREQAKSNLSDKLYDLFAELPLLIPENELNDFTIKCGKRRNDISHYGGPRDGINYDDFIEDVIYLMGAVDQLYRTHPVSAAV